MSSLTISHNFSGETGFIIAKPVKSTAPLSDVICIIDGVAAQTRKVYPAPHSQRSMLIEGLDPVWYLIKFYRSVDGIALDEEILTLAGNALVDSLYPITKYEYVVNRGHDNTTPVSTGPEVWADPVEGDIGIRDERLAGQVYWIEERGTGQLRTDEITDRTDDGGGFDFEATLVAGGKVMNDGATYIATVIERVDAAPTSGTGSSDYNSIVILTADLDFDPNIHSGRVLVANWSSDLGVLTMPNLSLLPDCKFKLQTHGGTQSYATIQFDAGDAIEFRKSDMNALHLGSGEEIEIIIKDNAAYVGQYSGDYPFVGQRIWGDANTELNAVLRNGTQYTQASKPRLMQWIDEYGVPTISEGTGAAQWGYSVVVDGETIFPNKGKFARDDVGGTIRVPDDRDRTMMALKNTDGSSDATRQSQGSGSFQKNTFKSHTHRSKDGFGYGNYSGGSNPFSRYRDPSDPFQSAGLIEATGDDKTRMDNTGMLPLLKI
jgi:hypothetical protein